MSKRLPLLALFVWHVEAADAPVAPDLRKVYDGFLSGMDELPRAALTDGQILMAWENEGRYAEMLLVGDGQYEWFTQDYATGDFDGCESESIDDLSPIRDALKWLAGPAGVAP